MKFSVNILALLVLSLSACNDTPETPATQTATDQIPAPVVLNYQVLNRFPHDTLSFTEGFTFYKGQMYESTGAPDEPTTNLTWAGPVDLATGRFKRTIDLGKSYFGEGITFLNDRMYQLTWKSKVGFVYDAKTFRKLRTFSYASEGWGLTNDGVNLVMSTGSSNLYYLNPDSLSFVKMLPVQDNNGYASNINELEYIDGYVYANQWLTPYILKIDPKTGYVVGRLDLSAIVNEMKTRYPDAEEMNGIAHDSTTGKTYITGKKWPFIYQISW